MVAALKREFESLFQRFGWRKAPDYRPHPQQDIDYDALFEEVSTQYPNIMKRLAE